MRFGPIRFEKSNFKLLSLLKIKEYRKICKNIYIILA